MQESHRDVADPVFGVNRQSRSVGSLETAVFQLH